MVMLSPTLTLVLDSVGLVALAMVGRSAEAVTEPLTPHGAELHEAETDTLAAPDEPCVTVPVVSYSVVSPK